MESSRSFPCEQKSSASWSAKFYLVQETTQGKISSQVAGKDSPKRSSLCCVYACVQISCFFFKKQIQRNKTFQSIFIYICVCVTATE